MSLLNRIYRLSASEGQRVGREYVPLFVLKLREDEKQELLAALSFYYDSHPNANANANANLETSK